MSGARLERRSSGRSLRAAAAAPYKSSSTGLTKYLADADLSWEAEEEVPAAHTSGRSDPRNSKSSSQPSRRHRPTREANGQTVAVELERESGAPFGLHVAGWVACGRSGCSISRVVPGSAGERAGLRAGDEILLVDGRTLTKPLDVMLQAPKYKNALKLKLTVKHDANLGKEHTASL